MKVLAFVLAGILALGLIGFVALLLSSDRAEAQRQWGFIDPEGRVAIAIQFDNADDFFQGLAGVETDGQWGFVDRTGRLRMEPEFIRVGRFEPSGLAWAEVGFQSGFLHLDGTWAVSPRFDRASAHTGLVGIAGKAVGMRTTRISGSTSRPIYSFGLIGPDFEWIVEPLDDGNPAYWSSVGTFSQGLCPVQIDGRLYGYVDDQGTMVIAPRFSVAGPFSDGLALTKLPDDSFEVIDRTGATVLSLGVSFVRRGEDGFLTILGSLGDEKGYYLAHVDGSVYQGPFDEAQAYTEGRLPVKTEDGWVLMDADGRFYGEAWDAMESLSEGRAAVGRTGRGFLADYQWGFVDQDGRVIISPMYDRVGPFRQGRARVSQKG